jgi:hypothetical protein
MGLVESIDCTQACHRAIEAALSVVKKAEETQGHNFVDEFMKLKQRHDRMEKVLRWLDGRGGLGLDAHEHIRKALEQ